jgi:hypothetical protein
MVSGLILKDRRLDAACQKSNYQFLPENVIYFSYISGIPMVSTPEIDSSNLYFALEIWEDDITPLLRPLKVHRCWSNRNFFGSKIFWFAR